MAEPSPRRLDVVIALGLSAVAASVTVGSGARGRSEIVQVSAAHSAVAPRGPLLAPRSSPASGPGPSSQQERSLGPPLNGAAGPEAFEFPRFFRALRGLEERTRKAPVRICWFGDSHTTADYLTGALRARLQARFGAGGPGFVRVGVRAYRHSQLHWAADGPWHIEPPQPARRSPFDDGVFGLGGLRAFPDGGPAFASIEPIAGTVQGELNWKIWYALPSGASFRLELSGSSELVTRARQPEVGPEPALSQVSLRSAASGRLRLSTRSGAPRFFGLTVEASEPGLVLDAIGIDGARVATVLAWNEASFEAGVRARAPSLVAFAFGTNEAFDSENVTSYRAQYRELRSRVRLAEPEAECLIVGPPDANAVTGGSEPRVAQIDQLQRSVAAELGCSYLSQLDIMGGAGGYSRWTKQTPPLARGDRLHLTPRGYETVASAIGDRLLRAYDRSKRVQTGE